MKYKGPKFQSNEDSCRSLEVSLQREGLTSQDEEVGEDLDDKQEDGSSLSPHNGKGDKDNFENASDKEDESMESKFEAALPFLRILFMMILLLRTLGKVIPLVPWKLTLDIIFVLKRRNGKSLVLNLIVSYL